MALKEKKINLEKTLKKVLAADLETCNYIIQSLNVNFI